MAPSLPRFVAFQSSYNQKYLEFICNGSSEVNEFLKFSGGCVDSPLAKFEIVPARCGNGLVHIKCSYNNKYLRRWSPSHWWIVAGSDCPNEDRCAWSCTLFRPIFNCGTVRLVHVQLGHYACLWRAAAPYTDCLFGGSPNPDRDCCDVYTAIDLQRRCSCNT